MENVRMAVLSADETVCTFFDNQIPDAMHYSEACLHTYLQGSAYTLEIETDTQHEDTQYLVEGNKVSFIHKNHDYMCNIVSVERTETDITVTCWGLLLELTNETREAYKSNGAMTLVQYINYIDPEHVLTLGINEVSDKKIANEWEGSQTILARLYSIANLFDAEMEFVTELNDDYSLKQVTLNVYRKHDEKHQGMGANRTDQVLRFGKTVETIRKTSDITDLFTAIHVIGKDGTETTGLNKKEYDSNGRLEYYTEGNTILAPLARDRFPSNLMKPNDGYILKEWTYDSDSKEVLYGQGLAQLKKYCVPQVTYEITGYYDANIGDTFTIVDDGYRPMLILEARVTEQEEFFVDPTKNTTTYSNVEEVSSEINSGLLAAMNAMIAANKTYICNITTDNGIIFKNGLGNTTLTAQVKDGAIDKTDDYVIQWYKDGNALTAAKSVTVRASDVVDKSVYRFIAYDTEGKEIGRYEVTLTNVDDGKNGKDGKDGQDGQNGKDGTPGADGAPGKPGVDGRTSYMHIAYANSSDGKTDFSTTDSNREYVGMYVDFTQEDSTDPAKYNWSLIKGADGTQGTPGKAGADGKTPYFHVAYANSDDGTEDFTTVYPNENLLTGTDFVDSSNWGAARPLQINGDGSASYTKNKTTTVREFITNTPYPPIIEGETYTVSIEVYLENGFENITGSSVFCRISKPNGTVFTNFIDISMGSVKTGEWTRLTTTKIIPDLSGADVEKGIQFSVALSNGAIGTIRIRKPKLELSTTPTIHIPDGESMTYIGQYTDYTQADSVDPSKYTWIKIKGETGATGAKGDKGDKGDTGATGQTGAPGENSITGELSLSPIILPANASGAVSSYSDAKGTFDVLDGTTQVTSGVTYSLLSATGVTVSINSSTGAYTVSSMPNGTDYGTAMLQAVYKGTKIQKILAVIKAKQGASGKGISTTAVTYQASPSGTTAPTGTWSSSIPSVSANQYLWTRTVTTYTDSSTTTAYSVGKMGANGATGATGATGAAGKDGVGISGTVVTYQASGSGTVTPTGTWLSTIPSVGAGQYLWTRTVTTYTNNSTSTAYSVGKMGINGTSGIIVSDSEPSSPSTGQLWQKPSDNIVKKWDGGKWVIWYLDVTNLSVENLAAITATIGTISNPYTTDVESEWSNEALKGEIIIGGAGIKNEYTQTSNGWKGMWRLSPQSYYTELRDTSGDLREGVIVEPGSISFYDYATKNWIGTSASTLSNTVVNKAVTLSYLSSTSLKGTIEFDTQVLSATATIQKVSGTPIGSTKNLNVEIRTANGKGYVDVYAEGSYVNGHVLAVMVMALVKV